MNPQPHRRSPIRRRLGLQGSHDDLCSFGNDAQSPGADCLCTFDYYILRLAIATFASQPGITVLGGYLGLLTAIAAWYASASIVIASTRKR